MAGGGSVFIAAAVGQDLDVLGITWCRAEICQIGMVELISTVEMEVRSRIVSLRFREFSL